MAKRNSQLTELLVVAQDDYLTIVDTSAGQSKRVSVKNLTGLPDVGWTGTGEAWTFLSWDSSTRTGVVTVPSDATTKYTKGMRVRISQSTGGTKYAIIHSISSTTLTLFFMSGQTLNNEAISTPVYSPLFAPYGFDAKPSNWQLEIVDSSARQGNTPTKAAWYKPSGATTALNIGIGEWLVEYYVPNRVHAAATSTWCTTQATLSTTTNSETNSEFTSTASSDQASSGTITLMVSFWKRRRLTLAAKTTFNLLSWSDVQGTMGSTNGPGANAMVRATSAYIN